MIINKPIVIFDIETTGLDIINDQIIDISLIKIDLDSSEKLKQYKIKPAIKISKESIWGVYVSINEFVINGMWLSMSK